MNQPFSAPNVEYHPPLPPHIPISAINTLIPRLTTTINDVDSLKALIAAGNADGSMPSWDTLLQRYSLLLGRINALTTYLSPPPAPAPRTSSRPGSAVGTPTTLASASLPPLSGYMVHPLSPPSGGTTESGVDTTDLFFQAINTVPLPSLSSSQFNLLDSEAGTSWHTPEQLRAMQQTELDLLRRSLRGRMEKEALRANAILDEIGRREEEVDWAMRIDEGDDEGEGDEGDEKEGTKEDEDEDDLFGGDEEDDMVIDVDAGAGADGGDVARVTKGPRDEWKIDDFVRFMDGGRVPVDTSASATAAS